MRLSKRLYSTLIACSLFATWSAPAQASSGLSFSVENLFAGLGKQSLALVPDEDGNLVQRLRFGRETTEWLGITGFVDLNKNWRVLYGGHMTWLGFPIFKLDTSLAFMLEMPKEIPLQPYFFLGATPILVAGDLGNVSPLSINAQAGIGIDYSWNQSLYSSLRLNSYLLNPFNDGQQNEDSPNLEDKNLDWTPFSFSLTFSTGMMF